MEWAALVTWVVTALFGFTMLSMYMSRGGPRQEQGIPARLLYGHFLLAAGGLVLWIVYLFTDSDALAWIALVDLAVVAVGGFLMFGIWAKHRQRLAAGAHPGSGGVAAAGGGVPAEQAFPVWVIALHGLFAVATVVLVLLTALGVGES
jgi:hypothetical protein